MKKVLLILSIWSVATWALAVPNAEVVTDGAVDLPQETQPRPRNYMKISTTTPLEPQAGPVTIVKPDIIPLTSPTTAIITTPPPIPLTSTDEPTLLPSATIPIEQTYSKTLYESIAQHDYRIVKMQLNDFAVAMSRKAGLTYIYNPEVRGLVNGYFRNTDPIYMIHMAAKANGYKMFIRNGIFLELEPEAFVTTPSEEELEESMEPTSPQKPLVVPKKETSNKINKNPPPNLNLSNQIPDLPDSPPPE